MQTILEKAAAIQGIFNEVPKHVPTNAEPDGPLCGNGDIGIANTCRPDDGALDFYLSKNDLWYTDLHADSIQGDRPGMRGFGCFSFGSDRLKDARYGAIQRISDATLETKLSGTEGTLGVDCCVLRKSNLIVFRLKAEGTPIPVWIRFAFTSRDGDNVEFSQKIDANSMHLTKLYRSPQLEWPTEAKAIAILWGQEHFSFTLEPGETVLMTVPFCTNQDTEHYVEQCALDAASADRKLETLENTHREWWNAFWLRSGISLPSEPQIERHWYASQYLMACCCEEGKFPPGIFGNWVTSDHPNWGADYHMNYNYQAPWWGVFSSNHIELSEPYDQPLLDYLPQAKEAAQKKLGCRGAYLLVGIGPKGLRTANLHTPDGNDDLNYWGQKSNSVYAAVNMLMRFSYTHDESYITDTAQPYLLAVADFWEDYLKLENGRYVIYNDCIHENGEAAMEDTKDCSYDFNPILTLGLLRMFFKGMLELSEILSIRTDRRNKWQDILECLSDFPLQQRNGKTVFRYSERGMDWCSSNTLGIQHIYPAGAIGLSSSKELLKIATDTLEELSRWEDYNGFPTFYSAAARIGYNPDTILQKMNAEIIKHGFPNLFLYYGGGGVECLSAIPGCINEMLLQSHEGILRFFPVWNREKDAAFESLRTYGAFLASASLTNGEIGDIALFSEKGLLCTVESPWNSGMEVICDGQPVTPSATDGRMFTFPTSPGKHYILRKMQK